MHAITHLIHMKKDSDVRLKVPELVQKLVHGLERN